MLPWTFKEREREIAQPIQGTEPSVCESRVHCFKHWSTSPSFDRTGRPQLNDHIAVRFHCWINKTGGWGRVGRVMDKKGKEERTEMLLVVIINFNQCEVDSLMIGISTLSLNKEEWKWILCIGTIRVTQRCSSTVTVDFQVVPFFQAVDSMPYFVDGVQISVLADFDRWKVTLHGWRKVVYLPLCFNVIIIMFIVFTSEFRKQSFVL